MEAREQAARRARNSFFRSKKYRLPKSDVEYWAKKSEHNRKRDAVVDAALENMCWDGAIGPVNRGSVESSSAGIGITSVVFGSPCYEAA